MGGKEKIDYDEELDREYLKELREEEEEDVVEELDLNDPDNYDFGDVCDD